jgi:hypothetical protein
MSACAAIEAACGVIVQRGLALKKAGNAIMEVVGGRPIHPGRLIVHAIEAADLTQGTGLTPAVAGSVRLVAAAILYDIGSFGPGSAGPPSLAGPRRAD